MGRREHADRSPHMQPVGLNIEKLRAELVTRHEPRPDRRRQTAHVAGFALGRLLLGAQIHREVSGLYDREGIELTQQAAVIYIHPDATRLAVWSRYRKSPNTLRLTNMLLDEVMASVDQNASIIAERLPIEITNTRLLSSNKRPGQYEVSFPFNALSLKDADFYDTRQEKRAVEQIVAGNPDIGLSKQTVISLGSIALSQVEANRLKELHSTLQTPLPQRAELGPLQVIPLN